MSRPVSIWLALIALSLSACSAVTEFDRKLIEERQRGMDSGTHVEGEGGGSEGGEGDGGELIGCEPGHAGDDCAPCEPGTFCAGGTAAKLDCPAGTVDHDLNAASPCVVQRTCSAGEFVAGEGSPTTDRACAPCSAGRFSTKENSPSCEPWTTCLQGEFVAMDGSTDHDQVCEDCQEGFFSAAPNSGRCVPYGSCAAGTKRQTPGATTGPCVSCMTGEYCPGENSPPEPCMASWDHDSNPASRCTAWTSCGAGMYVSTAGTATVDRVCTNCTAGTFSTTPNAMTCAPWTNCAAGTYASRTGDAAQDRVCTPCVAGTFNATQNATMCVAHRTCGPGTFVGTAGTASADRVCTACTTGQFSLGNNAASCTAWTVCRAGQHIATAGTAMANQVCATCPAGTYSAADNTSVCVPQGQCAAGTRQMTAGTAITPPVCAACAAGQYCAGGAAAPVQCGTGTNENYDHDNNSATMCQPWTPCVEGQAWTAGGTPTTNRTCTPCTSGFTSTQNARTCSDWVTCDAGFYWTSGGTPSAQRVCSRCPSGFTGPRNILQACQPWLICQAGEFVATAGTATTNRVCSACQNGTFSTGMPVDPNAPSMCLPHRHCSAGYFVSGQPSAQSDRQCQLCPTGWNSTVQDATQCNTPDDCRVGYRQVSANYPEPPVCAQCPARGWYCPGGANPGTACGPATTGGGGNWDDDGLPNTPCVAWSSCPAGTLISTTRGSSGTEDRACDACPAGRISGSNATSCTQCSAGTVPNTQATMCVACGIGFASSAGQATCTDCETVMGYSTTASAMGCTNWSAACASTHYQSRAPSRTQDRGCTMLDTCGAGSYESTPPGPMANRACMPCAIGGYSTGTNVSSCTACPAGTYGVAAGQSTQAAACARCPAGTASSATGAMSMTTCTACAGETWAPEGSPACVAWNDCQPPNYVASASTTTGRVCMPCTGGGSTTAANQPEGGCVAPDAGMGDTAGGGTGGGGI